MIPIRLEITDFLSYRGFHALDLSGIHVASIVGTNGSGKSALLDAISWVLFGKSREHNITGRKTNKQRDAVINDYADSCEVSLEFMVEGNRFLVNRAIDRGKSGWRVQFKRLTQSGEENIKDKGNIDSLIEKELGITFDVFFSSSFITQGDSSRFMEASVSGRLEVLSEILDLSIYEKCLDETKKSYRETENQIKFLTHKISDLKAESEKIPEIQKNLQEATNKSEELNKKRDESAEKIKQVNQQITEIDFKIKILNDKKSELEKAKRNLDDLMKQLEILEIEIIKQQQLIEKSNEIEEGFKKYQNIQKTLDIENEKKLVHEKLTSEIQKLESEIKLEKTRLKAEFDNATKNLEQVKTFISENIDAENMIKTVSDEKSKLSEITAEISKIEAKINESKIKIAPLQDSITKTKAKIIKTKDEVGIHESSELESEFEFLLGEYPNKIRQIQDNLEKSKSEQLRISEKITGNKTTINHIQSELEMLKTGEGGVCPLCGSELSSEKSDDIESEKSAKLMELKQEIAELTTKSNDLNKDIRSLESSQKILEKRHSKLPLIRQIIEMGSQLEDSQNELEEENKNLKTVEQKLESIKSENRELITKKDKIESEFLRLSGVIQNLESKKIEKDKVTETFEILENKLKNEEFCTGEKKKLKGLKIQLEENSFDAGAYQQILSDEKKYREFQQKMSELELAKEKSESIKKEKVSISKRISESEEKIENLTGELQSFDDVFSKKAEQLGILKSLTDENNTILKERDEAITAVSEQKTLLEKAKSAEIESAESQKLFESLSIDSEILQRLKVMFGRDGIPNQILEGVVPQLEEVANDILEKITKGRHSGEAMRMQFELSRESATGKRNTALDIILSDGQNERPYELFSGGERFRADFAIRLALSHILSRRSGRKLRLLVVDEGFGSQDSEGVSALVDAIHDVSPDFEKILVVSHVDEIKNHFDRQIQVWRDADGSHFELV